MFLCGLVGIIIFHSSNRALQSIILPLSPLDLENNNNNNNNNNTMTVVTLEQQEPDHVNVNVEVDYHHYGGSNTTELDEQDQETIPTLAHPMPSWVPELRSDWGETVLVDEWQQDDGTYRAKHGWQVRLQL
jgi:hypothetical protein